MRTCLFLLAALGTWGGVRSPAAAQQVGVGGGLGGAMGGFSSNSGGGFGFTGRGRMGDAMFNLFGQQGSRRGVTSTSSSVTVLDGHSGFFAAGSIQPFVTGVIPVVGDQPDVGLSGPSVPRVIGPGRSVLGERLSRLQESGETLGKPSTEEVRAREVRAAPAAQAGGKSTASEGAESIADIRRAQADAVDAERRKAEDHFAKGAEAESRGLAALAVYHFKIARRYATGELQRRASERIETLSPKR